MRTLAALAGLLLTVPFLLAADAPIDPLDRLSGKDVQVSLRFDRQPLPKVLRAIGDAAKFRMELDPELEDVVVTVNAANVTVRELLTQLARDHALRLEVPAADRLVVARSPRPD
jgi:hypothetical protein